MILNPVPRFTGVFHQKPADQPSRRFQPLAEDNAYDPDRFCYATGEEAEQLKTSFQVFSAALRAYNRAKETVLKNTGQLSSNQITIIVSTADKQTESKPDVAARKANDRTIEERCKNFEGYAAFIEARNHFEEVEQARNALTERLAAQAQ